jgi:hypothetical protein
VNAGALFRRLRRGRHGVEMERQKKHEQHYRRADQTRKVVPILHTGIKHRFRILSCPKSSCGLGSQTPQATVIVQMPPEPLKPAAPSNHNDRKYGAKKQT